MRLTIAFKNITFREITKRSLLIAFKEDNSASLVIYTNALVFKNTYEVVLNQSLRFLPKLVFYFLFHEGRLVPIQIAIHDIRRI